MSDFNELITDTELRELLKLQLVDQSADDPLIQQMTEMEATIAFADGAPVLMPPHREQELLKKLQNRFTGRHAMQWFLSGIGVVLIAATTWLFAGRSEQKQQPAPPVLPQPARAIGEDAPSAVTIHPGNHAAIAKVPEKQAEPRIQQETIAAPEPGEGWPAPAAQSAAIAIEAPQPEEKILADTIFSGITMVEVQSGFCDVNIQATGGDKVTAKSEIDYEEKGLVIGKRLYNLSYERKDTLLKIVLENKGKTTLVAGSIRAEGKINLVVPAKTNLVIKAKSGNISLSGLSGRVCEMESGYGNITADQVNTPLNIKAGSGNVSLNKVTGNILCRSTYGNAHLSDITGTIRYLGSSGDVNMENVTGDAEVKLTYGNLDVSRIRGSVKVSASSGDTRIADVQGRSVSVNASYGNVKISNVEASLSVSSSAGTITVNDLKGDAVIASTYGDINTFNCTGNMELKAESGDINGSNLDLADRIKVQTTYGNIRISTKNKEEDLSFDLHTVSGTVKVHKGETRMTGRDGSLLIKKGKVQVTAQTVTGDQLFE